MNGNISEQEWAKPQPGVRSLFGLVQPYAGWVVLLLLFTLTSNGLALTIPVIISHGIDAYTQGTFVLRTVVLNFFLVAVSIFLITGLQSIIRAYTSERVARDLREQITAKLSMQSYGFVQTATPAKLLTNLTSDVDAVKLFVPHGFESIVSCVLLLFGASAMLLSIHWKLALAVLAIVPVIGGTFFVTFMKVRPLFRQSREVIDRLNNVINESILASALVRVLNAQHWEVDKFLAVNTDARELGLRIVRLFALLLPVITFSVNMATLVILGLGGHFVIAGSMTLGQFAAFNSYLTILIFPVLIIGMMSHLIARATVAHQRICAILSTDERATGTDTSILRGDIELKDVCVSFDEKPVLRNVSLAVKAGTRTAVIGPTGAGKTQLLYLLVGLLEPDTGSVEYDGKPLETYDKEALHRQVGLVFQDSIIFNMTLRENIAFGATITDDDLRKVVETSELSDFVRSLPKGLETVVSERGTSLSGGQKQRVMLARALALNPRVLLLDDFTARVDPKTERKILANVLQNYPGITLISVTQRVASADRFDRVVLLMEGEMLAQGTHQELMRTSPEYVQILQSQRSTSHYELHAR